VFKGMAAGGALGDEVAAGTLALGALTAPFIGISIAMGACSALDGGDMRLVFWL
jgi:hypothetical protein